MHLTRIDASDADQFDPWFDVWNRSERFRASGQSQGWHPEEIRARAVRLDAARVNHLLALHEGDELVAVASVEVSRDDNLHRARTDFHVDPALRRRGYGTRGIVEVERYVADLGRTEILLDVIEGPHEVGSAPNRYFAPRVGYRLVDEGIRREIDWPRPAGELDRLEHQWRPYAAAYEILDWTNPSPAAWLDDLAHLYEVMPVEAPHGDLEIDPETWDARRVREYEATTEEMGRDLFMAVACDVATHHLVGFTELTVSRAQPRNAYQWSTLVLGAHRGHRLGGLLKIQTMRRLAASGHATTHISTFNSVTNGPMIAVNVALGARVAGGRVEWVRSLDAVR